MTKRITVLVLIIISVVIINFKINHYTNYDAMMKAQEVLVKKIIYEATQFELSSNSLKVNNKQADKCLNQVIELYKDEIWEGRRTISQDTIKEIKFKTLLVDGDKIIVAIGDNKKTLPEITYQFSKRE